MYIYIIIIIMLFKYIVRKEFGSITYNISTLERSVWAWQRLITY